MKLLIVTAGVLPVPVTKGGAVETLIEHLIEENEKINKFDITVISIYDKESQNISDGYNYCKFEFIKRNKFIVKILDIINIFLYRLLNIKSFNKIDYITKVEKIVKNNFYDIILVENVSEYVLKIAKFKPDNIYLHIHNDYLSLNTNQHKEIYQSSKKIITVSEYIRNRVLLLPDAKEEKIVTLKNCVDTDKFSFHRNHRDEIRKKLNIEPNDIVIMFSGRISKTKGIKELILAFKKIKNNNVKLLILGGTWYGTQKKDRFYKELEELVIDIKDRVIFTGYIESTEISKYNEAAEIAVVPSIWEEPAGLTVLEAMASGLPLVLTNSGGMLEIVTEECAFIVNRDEYLIDNLYLRMQQLVDNEEMRINMGKCGFEIAQQYNKKIYFQEFCSIVGV